MNLIYIQIVRRSTAKFIPIHSWRTALLKSGTKLYYYIYQCNTAIDGIAASTGISDSLKGQFIMQQN